MKLLTSRQSRELDRLSQRKYGVASYALMTRAGHAVADTMLGRFSQACAIGVTVIAGKGNNGGDGMVAARRLLERGAGVRVVSLASGAEVKGDAARARAEYLSAGGEISEALTEADLESLLRDPRGALIDAIFGTGLNAEIRGHSRRAIELVNGLGRPITAVDIASGVNADTGAIMGAAVRASLTVTFGYAKFGHVSYPGAECCGDLEICGIGFAPQAIDEIAPKGLFLERADAASLMAPRGLNSHKGMYGHPLVIAGSRGKSGAALLAGRGALRTGAGLVTVAVPESVASIVAAGQAELMTEAIRECDGHFASVEACNRLGELLEGKSALMVGPGIGVSEETKQLVSWLVTEGVEPGRPLLIDADGLNAVAALGCKMLREARGPVVLTPHPGEMARLLGVATSTVNADRISAACRLVDRTGAWVLLKGARSVVAAPGGEVYVNSTGNPGMATPGMGDALTGIVGALLGQGMDPLDALALGSFVHGEAADRLAREVGPVGYVTGDLLDEIPRALRAVCS